MKYLWQSFWDSVTLEGQQCPCSLAGWFNPKDAETVSGCTLDHQPSAGWVTARGGETPPVPKSSVRTPLCSNTSHMYYPQHSASDLSWALVYVAFGVRHCTRMPFSPEGCEELNNYNHPGAHPLTHLFFFSFWLSVSRGLLDPAGILCASHILKPSWFWFLCWKPANHPQAACKPAPPAVAAC